MIIGLHDSDDTGFPNYALMKISAWHKKNGDTVEWWNPLLQYDKIYSSKVFTFTPENPYLPPNTIKGGTGYGIYDSLPDEIDDMFPDYSIYPKVNYAIGYLTRGCIRNCPWCVVPKKEGKIRAYRTWREIKRTDSRDIVFMDNNVLACEHGIEQMKDMVCENVRVDFNQGLDARLITPEIAELLGKLKWIEYVRVSCDTDAMLDVVLEKAQLLERGGGKTMESICICSCAGYHVCGKAMRSAARGRIKPICTAIQGLYDKRGTGRRTKEICKVGKS